jgi:hypothetical protein
MPTLDDDDILAGSPHAQTLDGDDADQDDADADADDADADADDADADTDDADS